MAAATDFGFRSLTEWLRKATKLYLEQQQQEKFTPLGFDISSLPITKQKAYPKPRTAKVDLIVCHVTAIKGGFGVSKSAVKYWLNNFDKIPAQLDAQLQTAMLPHDQKLAERLALWSRFRDTPYHQLALPNGDIIFNHPTSRHTWHGNGGNIGCGFAVDCAPDEKLSNTLIETARQSLAQLITRLQKEEQTSVRVTAHRAFSSDRLGDPGPNVWREIIIPAVAGEAEIDYTLRKDSGRPIPKSWDPRALFDDKGKRVE